MYFNSTQMFQDLWHKDMFKKEPHKLPEDTCCVDWSVQAALERTNHVSAACHSLNNLINQTVKHGNNYISYSKILQISQAFLKNKNTKKPQWLSLHLSLFYILHIIFIYIQYIYVCLLQRSESASLIQRLLTLYILKP